MSGVNNENQTDPNKMQEEIVELRSKYDHLNKEVQQLEKNKITLGDDIKQIHGEFEQINKSVEDILLKLSKLSNEYDEMGNETYEDSSITHSMKNFFTNPLRKIAIGTLSAIYTVADKTMEKSSSFKESLEDIVAEAQYANKKKRMSPAENN